MNDIMGADFVINSIFDKITESKRNESSRLFSVWEKILKKINGCGQNLYENTSLVDIKNNILLVEATHNGWIQTLQLHSKFILNGLNIYAPDLAIRSLAFRLRGSDAKLYEVNYDERLKIERQKEFQKFSEQEKILEKYEQKQNKTEKAYTLPDELLKKFEDMKKNTARHND